MLKNRNLLIIALIVVVNALGYAIIIPILYAYSHKFGLSDFQNGLLFAVFSLCQFLSTPFIGRLSDKYGRRPLLILSLSGTALSFFMMAFAPNAVFLFLARALDGITAGNIPVASAVISDTTSKEDRAKGFGIIGASWGFGMVFGPAISALTVGISDALPFIIAGCITIVAVILTAVFLPETNKFIGEVKEGKLFDLPRLARAMTDPNVGTTLLITLFYSLAFSIFIYAFQPFALNVLQISEAQNSLIFTIFGLLGLVAQLVVLPRLTKMFGLKKAFAMVLIIITLAYIAYFFVRSFAVFIAVSIFLGLVHSTVSPMVQTVISRETDENSQGSMMGVNASYMSIGQIIGPILGGILATILVPLPFLACALCTLICFFLSFKVMRPGVKKESAF